MGYSAADIERYVYCPLSWWLSRKGVEGTGDAIESGVQKHNQKGRSLREWQRTLWEHRHALDTAIHLAMVAAAAATLAIEVTFLDFSGVYNRVLMLLSLFWLFVALGFLLRAMRKQEEAKSVELESGLVGGKLAYSDLDRPGEVLRSDKYEIGGRPDYIVKKDGHFIPVEVKTGKPPKQPHDSHMMQAAAYCVLVEEVYGKAPPYGVLTYEDKAFEIPYHEGVKDRVLETVLRMRLAEATGNVHRNHQRRGKCIGCSRRDLCPERLQ